MNFTWTEYGGHAWPDIAADFTWTEYDALTDIAADLFCNDVLVGEVRQVHVPGLPRYQAFSIAASEAKRVCSLNQARRWLMKQMPVLDIRQVQGWNVDHVWVTTFFFHDEEIGFMYHRAADAGYTLYWRSDRPWLARVQCKSVTEARAKLASIIYQREYKLAEKQRQQEDQYEEQPQIPAQA